MNEIRNKILALIKEQNITQKELASRASVSYISLNRFLTGNRRGIGMESLLCIARGLNISAENLLFSGDHTIDDELRFITEEINAMPKEDKVQIINLIKAAIKIYHNTQ